MSASVSVSEVAEKAVTESLLGAGQVFTKAAPSRYGAPIHPPKELHSTSTVEGCVEVLGAQVQRVRDALGSARHHADLIEGHQPETTDAGPNVKLEAAPNGYVEALAQHLRNLDLAINELVHHHGRVSRALNG